MSPHCKITQQYDNIFGAFRLSTTGNFFHLTNDFFYCWLCMHLTLGDKQKHETWYFKNIPYSQRRYMWNGKNKKTLQQTDPKTISMVPLIPCAILQCDLDILPIKKFSLFIVPCSPFWSTECSRSDPWKAKSSELLPSFLERFLLKASCLTTRPPCCEKSQAGGGSQ